MPETESDKGPGKAPPPPDISGAFFLIDGNSLAYRAFYALPETIATSEGFPTNALYGFCTMLVKIINDYQPAGVIVAWDAGKKVFRHEQYEEYKAHRKPMPDSLSKQFPRFEELVAAFGFSSVRKEGYEADDLLATLAREARERGRKAVIVTADRDALQLVGDGIFVMSNTKGISEVKIYDSAAVEERYGIPPAKVPDFIGLKGDSSDNIPGVPGVGDKTAAVLLQDYDTLEDLLTHTDKLKGKRRQLLEENRELALMSKELATMNDEVPLEPVAALAKPPQPDRSGLREVLSRYEFNTLLVRLEESGMVEAAADDGVTVEALAVEPGELAGHLESAAEAALAWEESDGALRMALYAGEAQALTTTASPELLAEILTSPMAPPLLAHDIKPLLIRVPAGGVNCIHDTEIAAYLLKPQARTYGLDQLAAAAGIRAAATGAGDDPLPADAVCIHKLAKKQRQELERQGLTELMEAVEMPLVGVLAAMERYGFRLDLARLGELAQKVSDQIDQLADEIKALAGEEFNIDSPQQLAVILFERLGLPVGKKTKTGYSTDASVLNGLRDAHPIIAKIESYRELAKLSGTYLQALPKLADPDTWRIHTTFNQTVTATGRLSSSNPNLQNIPVRTPLGEQIRDCFVAEEGWKLVAADYSQVELRVMAHLSGEPKLRDAFARGEDVHRATAAEVFNIEPGAVTSRERGRAKAVNFGIMYGISAFGLAEQLDIPREEAASYIEAYLARYPKVAEFCQGVIGKARDDGYVTTLFGRRRPIPELRSEEERIRRLGERLAVNTVIQGSAADIIKVAMIACSCALKDEGLVARLILQVHDELIFEAPAAEADAVATLARREMSNAFALDPPLEVDVGVGETWLEAK